MRWIVCAAAAALVACGGSGGGTDPNPEPASVTIAVSGGTGDMTEVNETRQLTATVRDAQNNVMTGMAVAWTSSAPAVVSVSPASGVATTATAHADGSATITAAVGDVDDDQSLTVAIDAGGGGPFPNTAAVTATTSSTFEPASVDIEEGGTVTWQFESVTHNVRFSSASAPSDIGNTTNANVSRTFNTAGTFDYSCSLHAGMTGTVVVH